MLKSGGRAVWRAAVAVAMASGVAAAQGDMGRAMTDKEKSAMKGMGADAVEYTVVFKSSWTKARHPFEYPEAGVISGPHFSGLIGASHNASFTLFGEGKAPTAGIERLAEEGKHSPLDAELRAAMSAGAIGMLTTTGPLRDFADSLVTTVRVDAAHPMISLAAMIAPSPDWFAGLAGLSLQENGSWVARKTVELHAYDAGSDDGMTYKADDRDASPKKPVSKASGRHFAPNGAPAPVASITFIRK